MTLTVTKSAASTPPVFMLTCHAFVSFNLNLILILACHNLTLSSQLFHLLANQDTLKHHGFSCWPVFLILNSLLSQLSLSPDLRLYKPDTLSVAFMLPVVHQGVVYLSQEPFHGLDCDSSLSPSTISTNVPSLFSTSSPLHSTTVCIMPCQWWWNLPPLNLASPNLHMLPVQPISATQPMSIWSIVKPKKLWFLVTHLSTPELRMRCLSSAFRLYHTISQRFMFHDYKASHQVIKQLWWCYSQRNRICPCPTCHSQYTFQTDSLELSPHSHHPWPQSPLYPMPTWTQLFHHVIWSLPMSYPKPQGSPCETHPPEIPLSHVKTQSFLKGSLWNPPLQHWHWFLQSLLSHLQVLHSHQLLKLIPLCLHHCLLFQDQSPCLLHPFPHLGLLSDLRHLSADILLSYYIALVS